MLYETIRIDAVVRVQSLSDPLPTPIEPLQNDILPDPKAHRSFWIEEVTRTAELARRRSQERVMDRERMGELLAKLGQLTPHDIDEILAEQRHTRQRFGAIAVSLGFCQPEHVWAAWCTQLNGHVEPVDLDALGIDAQALEFLPRELALSMRAMPVRVFESQLVIAVDDITRAACVSEVARRVGMDVKCVLAPEEQVETALAKYYPTLQAAG
jgi:hypothetical protein